MSVDEQWPSIEFDAPREQRWLCGLNPQVAGYQRRISRLACVCAAVCVAVGLLACGLALTGSLSPLRGLALLVICVVVLAAMTWMRSRTEFCDLCGARTKHALAKQKLAWCPGCDNLNDPAQLGVQRGEVFDVTREDNFYHTDPIPRFLAMTICLAVLDQGHQITYEPGQGRYGVTIAIAGETYELEEPPAHFQFAAAQTVKALAGLDLANCSDTQEGRLHIRVYDRIVAASVLVLPTEFGQKVVLRWSGNEAAHRSA